jgi:tetraacyldisaccharide 4'-kinase
VDQKAFHDLASGKAQGLTSNLLRGLLLPISQIYKLITLSRNALYHHRILPSHAPPCPVICIGNLTTGGTGKTPLVAWLCRTLSETKKLRVVVLTRGYKSNDTQTDEPAMLEKQLGNTPVIVNANRIEGTKTALARGPVDIFVMDDGFQHQRLARDLNIVTLDATNPFGYGKLLPAGLLREPVAALKRAQCAVITRTDQISAEKLKALKTTIQSICPSILLATTAHSPTAVHLPERQTQPTSWLNGRKVFAFCGIGNPQAFFMTLENLGANLVGNHVFDDHYHCTEADLRNLLQQALQNQAEILLTTEKNYPDIAAINTPTSLPVGYLTIELAFESGEDNVKELIEKTLAGKISPS